MDINRLRHAIAVANEGSFSAAAQALPMSQSALTRSVQALELEYGLRIFERSKKGVRLTQEGAAFIGVASETLMSIERGEERLSAIALGGGATVRFGAGPLMVGRHLPMVLPRLAQLPVRLEIHTGSHASLTALLSRGEIDFFLGGTYADSDRFLRANEFRWEPTSKPTDEIHMIVRNDHPILEDGVRWDLLGEYPVASESFVVERLGRAGFEYLGLQFPSVEIDDYHVLSELAANSDHLMISNAEIQWMKSDTLTRKPLPRRLITGGWRWGFLFSGRLPLSLPSRMVMNELKAHLRVNAAFPDEGE